MGSMLQPGWSLMQNMGVENMHSLGWGVSQSTSSRTPEMVWLAEAVARASTLTYASGGSSCGDPVHSCPRPKATTCLLYCGSCQCGHR